MRPTMEDKRGATNGGSTGLSGLSDSLALYWSQLCNKYGFRVGQICVLFLYGVYKQLTMLNLVVFLLKYIPTGVYMYKLLQSVYKTSQERIKQKQMEFEDIQLQIQIVNTKLCVRDAEFAERAEQLRRGAEGLRAVRARVRALIDADDTLRRALENAPYANDIDLRFGQHSTPEQEREFLISLMKELKSENVKAEREKMDCGEHQPAPSTPESVYSSLSDPESYKDCRVKIVKVTNVYKVAYLKHYIKQKRLRRATQQALLKKKIESIKKLLESWQKSLNAVINNKLLIEMNLASQEAMGDYSKPTLHSSDSDSDLKQSCEDNLIDEFSLSWTQNPYSSYAYEDFQETQTRKEFFDNCELHDLKYPQNTIRDCDCGRPKNVLFVLPEETISQVAIEEIKSETEQEPDESRGECRDIVPL